MPEIFIADTSSIDGSMETQITYLYNAYNPQWSVDGNKIYFNSFILSDSFEVSIGNLFVVDINTGETEQFTTDAVDNEANGNLSPDETQIVFFMGPYQIDKRIFLTDLDASFIEELTTGPEDTGPKWSNEGSKIIFMRDENPDPWELDYAIYMMNPDGTDLLPITDEEDGDAYGDMNPDIFIDTTSAYISEQSSHSNISDVYLEQCYPNPFNSTTVVSYRLPQNQKIQIILYDITGRIVRQLWDGAQVAGYHKLLWNGKDDAGNHLPSGLYFCRIQTASSTKARKIVLIK